MLVCRGSTEFLGHFSWLPGTEVAYAQDDSWSCRFLIYLYVAAKPSHMGADVNGLTCCLHFPMVCSGQMRGQGILTSVAPSHYAVVGGEPFRGARSPGLDI
jgi:hypothetical protein